MLTLQEDRQNVQRYDCWNSTLLLKIKVLKGGFRSDQHFGFFK